MNKLKTMHRTLVAIAVTSVLASALVACGKKVDSGATQVIASVDGQEITVHQMNAILSKASGVAPERLTAVKAEILSALVDQQIAINAAVDKKLDRSPEVVAAIEAAKREILARAAMEQIASAQAQPTDDEAKKYYADNPALFAERRIYNLQEITFPKADIDESALRVAVNNAKSAEDISTWLKQHDIKFAANSGVRGAEQLPLEILPKLAMLKDGQMALHSEGSSYVIMRVNASKSEPVSEAQALPLIKTYLFNQRGVAAIKQFKADVKAKAKIEYFGEFKGGEAALKAKAEEELKAAQQAKAQQEQKAKEDAEAFAKQKAQEQAAAQAAEEERAKARAEARSKSGKEDAGATAQPLNLEKGLKGLK
ncbi:EpsD family peptidyl-prolyl cis-trans isomerase [Curvibacter sp. CHRR-16]|uniref:EpsD family peptidyl-prolyl cis-trans isomerase n=1 Tax=Curvibacter sp. CHRR-16 TaxID=2835872 RepID=UPI001BD91541|nr:EpsD family peptidyl-prolyl cis-trans isomerase [Curvibacter sp. CHRR-16]MBT0571535.1 EpsD family peptidyl-prolyl cis-trans isomerase [Curvibacter sp. CHRR-16]